MKASTTLSFFFSLAAVSAQGTNCPAPGTKTSSGDVACDPKVEYPNEACALIGDCYFLRGLGLLTSGTDTATATVTATSSAASSTTTCPPPGETNAAGDYSCNPAHSYPNQACALIGDCYFLRGLGLLTNSTVPVIISTKLPSNISFTTVHPTTVAPKPFTTTFVTTENGVPVTKVVVTSTGGSSEPTNVVVVPTDVATAGASQLSAVGGLAVFGLVFALL
ncbi:hypothetical protein CC79DRAFT_1369350 [Sarocladium strictum]